MRQADEAISQLAPFHWKLQEPTGGGELVVEVLVVVVVVVLVVEVLVVVVVVVVVVVQLAVAETVSEAGQVRQSLGEMPSV